MNEPSSPNWKNQLAAWHYQAPHEASVLSRLALGALNPLALGYEIGVRSRIIAYEHGWLESVACSVPVISVGNLTTGGTGKTPVIIALAQGLARAGKSVLVLSRGYGAALPAEGVLAGDPRHGDEACLIQEQVPEAVVMIGRRRERVLQQATTNWQPDFVLLDDGFQYLRLKRDMNILLFDGEAMIGNGRLLPAGPLREPISQIKRADVIFITRHVSVQALNQVEQWMRQYHPRVDVPVIPVPFQVAGLRAVYGPRSLSDTLFPAEALAGRPVIAFSGIARPESFEQNMRQAGLQVQEHHRFHDHHVYTQHDAQKMLATAAQFFQANHIQPIFLTTDKDWPKVREFFVDEASKLKPIKPKESLDFSGLPDVYTLQTVPGLDGQWFYEEFLTQLARRAPTDPTSKSKQRQPHKRPEP